MKKFIVPLITLLGLLPISNATTKDMSISFKSKSRCISSTEPLELKSPQITIESKSIAKTIDFPEFKPQITFESGCILEINRSAKLTSQLIFESESALIINEPLDLKSLVTFKNGSYMFVMNTLTLDDNMLRIEKGAYIKIDRPDLMMFEKRWAIVDENYGVNLNQNSKPEELNEYLMLISSPK